MLGRPWQSAPRVRFTHEVMHPTSLCDVSYVLINDSSDTHDIMLHHSFQLYFLEDRVAMHQGSFHAFLGHVMFTFITNRVIIVMRCQEVYVYCINGCSIFIFCLNVVGSIYVPVCQRRATILLVRPDEAQHGRGKVHMRGQNH